MLQNAAEGVIGQLINNDPVMLLEVQAQKEFAGTKSYLPDDSVSVLSRLNEIRRGVACSWRGVACSFISVCQDQMKYGKEWRAFPLITS